MTCCVVSFVTQAMAEAEAKKGVGTESLVGQVEKSGKDKSSIKPSKPVVVFTDGTVITDEEIREKMEEVPEAVASQMPLTDLKKMIAFKMAYDRVMTTIAKKSGITEKKEIKEEIEKRLKTFAAYAHAEQEASKAAAKEGALQEKYDKQFERDFKGTKEFSLVAIATTDEKIANTLAKEIKDEKTLKEAMQQYESNGKVKSMAMNDKPQAAFPPEVTKEILKGGKGALVGPFRTGGSVILFYIKDIHDAIKRELTPEFAEAYKKIAIKDFVQDYLRDLYKKKKARQYDLITKKEIDPFAEIPKKEAPETDDGIAKKIEQLKGLPDEQIMAEVGDKKITIADVKRLYKIKNLGDEMIVSLAKQFGINILTILNQAAKLQLDEEVLTTTLDEKFMNSAETSQRIETIRSRETRHAWYADNIKITPQDIKRAYEEYIQSIPEDAKNDHEIALKLAFFKTHEDAAASKKEIQDGNKNFSQIYEQKTTNKPKEGVDLGYVRQGNVSPEFWQVLKKTKSATCYGEIVELNGEQYGVTGCNYALVYVADRRPIQLPSLANENERSQFQKMAERKKAVEVTNAHMEERIKTINGIEYKNMAKAERSQILASIIEPFTIAVK